MADLSAVIEQMIREAIAAGEFSNLPGEGKPLKLDDDANVPESLKLAHKILKENGFAPDWILERRALEETRGRLLARLRHELRTQKQRSQGVELERIGEYFSEAAGRLNKRLLTHNLKLPPGVAHLAYFDVEREARRALEQMS